MLLREEVILGHRGSIHEYADAPHAPLLRTRTGGRCDRNPAKKRDELAPSHSITSSASAESIGGTWRPSARAVLR